MAGMAAVIALCTLCCSLAALPSSRAQGGEESAACLAAVSAQQLLLNTGAVMRNLTMPFTTNQAAVPTPELLNATAIASAAAAAARPSTNLVTAFPMDTPYAFWGNGLFQLATGYAVHVPAATLGEMVYASNIVVDLWRAAAAEAAAANTTVPANVTFALWVDTWSGMALALQERAEESDDVLNKRALLLRSLNYLYTAWYPTPTAPEYLEVYRNATAIFREAMDLFDAYSTSFFTVPYSNGTAEGDMEAFLVTPSPNSAAGLIIVLGSIYNWKEVQFVRYGLAALRRGYAVLFFDQPGQGLMLHEAPYFPMAGKSDKVVAGVLDTLKRTPQLARLVNFDNVIVAGNSLGAYAALQACEDLMPKRVAGCVLSPGIKDLGALVVDVLAARVYGAFSAVAAQQPELFGSPAVAEAFADPGPNIITALLEECSANSSASQLLGAMLAGQTDPELLYGPLTMLGLATATADELSAAVFPAIKRGLEKTGDIDVSGMRGPVLILGGEQDWSLGSQEERLLDAFEGTDADATLVMFPPESGAAMTTQLGAVTAWEQAVFEWTIDNSLASSSGGKDVSVSG